ncbi:MAG: hypothetical protein QME52_05465 [Bacteroidota bacterium]|nr:hypothetical protein [Bacteroidota bacterium]
MVRSDRDNRVKYICLYITIVVLFFSSASAQFFYFGRNKVQYTNFDWHVLKTEHFDIYYYPEMKELAEQGAYFAEESYKILEQKFVHNVLIRIPLIFYSSHLHFQQTNVTPGFVPEGVGGFFEFMKGRVVIPFNGSFWDFKHVIRHELVHVFMLSKINRVLLDHRQRQDRLPPLWFVEGLAEFWSTDWDIQAEMVMRDAVISNYLVPLNEMEKIYGTYLMYKEGQNILQHISEKYGREKILFLMENIWKSTNFEEVFELTLGVNYQKFDEGWIYGLKKKYYPLLEAADQPSGITKALVADGFNSKPTYFQNGTQREIYFIGNLTGYTGIYNINLDSALTRKEFKPTLVIEGERTSELETFHLFQSKLDIAPDGILAFVTKSGENDAIHLYDVINDCFGKSYNFNELVVIGSLSWSPDGKKIALTAVDKSGYNDLYIWDTGQETLLRLTNDVYDERDPCWSPLGDKIVFTSDRTPYGKNGKYNLFTYDLNTHAIQYLTYGKESYYSPQFSYDGSSLLFTSDHDGARNIWIMKLDTLAQESEMRKITHFTTAAFDPIWVDSSLVFVSFENFRFQIRYLKNLYNESDIPTSVVPLNIFVTEQKWEPQSVRGISDVQSSRYTGKYSIDVAQSQISTDPVFGTSGGAFLSLSDLLGNEQYNFLLYNTAQSSDELLTSFNIAISRISLERRTQYAYGIYQFSGRRYDLTDPDLYYYERSYGGYYALIYPLSHFQRVGLSTNLSHSEKDVEGFFSPFNNNIDRSRRAMFLSNAISFTHDNSLWGPSGPLDGSRFNITLAYTSDIQYSHANYYSMIFDYRYYLRIARRSAYASRFWLFFNDGEESRRFFMGGSWDLRGYQRWSLRGKKLWLTSHELRFPFLDQLTFKFPFGGVNFIGFRGALFIDAGSAWDEKYESTLGSVGGGIRLNIGNVFVLRYDLGKRIENNFKDFQKGIFSQFFFGWDF